MQNVLLQIDSQAACSTDSKGIIEEHSDDEECSSSMGGLVGGRGDMFFLVPVLHRGKEGKIVLSVAEAARHCHSLLASR